MDQKEKELKLKYFFEVEDTVQKILFLDKKFLDVFGIDNLIVDLISVLEKDRRYFADNFYKLISDKILNFFRMEFDCKIELSNPTSGSKIYYNFWLFMSGDWVLKNELKNNFGEVVNKDLTLLHALLYKSNSLKERIEFFKKQRV